MKAAGSQGLEEHKQSRKQYQQGTTLPVTDPIEMEMYELTDKKLEIIVLRS